MVPKWKEDLFNKYMYMYICITNICIWKAFFQKILWNERIPCWEIRGKKETLEKPLKKSRLIWEKIASRTPQKPSLVYLYKISKLLVVVKNP